MRALDDVVGEVQERTGGRGADGVIDAVGMEAHGSPLANMANKAAALLSDKVATSLSGRLGVDSLGALYDAFKAVRWGRHGVDHRRLRRPERPVPHDGPVRQGRAAAHGPGPRAPLDRRDPAGAAAGRRRVGHGVPLHSPAAVGGGSPRYELFQKKQDGAIKVVLKPGQT